MTILIIWYLVILLKAPAGTLASPVANFFRNLPAQAVYMSSLGAKWVSCSFGGNCATPVATSDDTTRYGIYLSSGSLTPTMGKFRKDDDIVVKAKPTVALIGTENKNSCATVSCEIEDGTVKSIYPSSQICFGELQRGAAVGCTFNPIISKTSSNTKKVTISLTYPFEASATLPVSVIDPSTYDGLERFYLRDSVNFDQVGLRTAQHYNINQGEKASSIRAPLMIGAYIDTPQPISQGKFTLVVTAENAVGGGIARFDSIHIELPEGMVLVSSTEVNFDNIATPVTIVQEGITTFNKYVLQKDTVWSMDDDIHSGDFKSFNFEIDTSGAEAKASWRDAYHGRIYLSATYTYTTSAETFVKVSTCEELNTCETEQG